jgi:hypothetical protein
MGYMRTVLIAGRAKRSAGGVIELGDGVPAVALRAVIGLAGAGIVVVLANSGVGGLGLILIAASALMSAGVPASPAPSLVVLLVAVLVVAIGGNPFAPHVLLLVPLLHLLHVSCAVAGLIPARSRIRPSALRAPAIRFVAIQAGVFALAGFLAVAPTGRVPEALEFIAIAGIATIAVILWRLVHRAL